MADRITFNMRRWLTDLRDGRDPASRLRTQSDHGGATRIVMALKRRDLIDRSGAITDAGRNVLAEPSRPSAGCGEPA